MPNVTAYFIYPDGRQQLVFSENMVSSGTKNIALVKSPDDQYDAKYTIDYSINNEYPSMLGSVTASTSDMSYNIFPKSTVESTEWYFTITYESVYISISYNLNGGTRVGGNDARTYGSYDIFTLPSDVIKDGYYLTGFTGPFTGVRDANEDVTINVRMSGVIVALYDTYITYEYDLNGGTKSSGNNASTTIKNGETIALPIASKPFHIFKHYITIPDIGIEYILGNMVTIDRNIKYTMIWESDGSFSIRSPIIYERPIYIPKTVKEYYIKAKPINVSLSDSITARTDSDMVSIGTNIYIFGGSLKSGALLNDLIKIDTLTNEVTFILLNGNTDIPKLNHSMVAIGTNIYIFGGFSSDNLINKLYKIDTNANDIITNISYNTISHRSNNSMVAIGNDIYIIGGYDGTNYFNDFYKINTLNNELTPILGNGNNKIPVIGITSVVAIENKIYLFSVNKFYIIDTLGNLIFSGTMNETFNSFRNNYNIVAIDNYIYLFGGNENQDGFIFYNDFYRINKESNEVLLYTGITENIISARSSIGMTSIGNNIYIFGGVSNFALDRLNDFYKIPNIR